MTEVELMVLTRFYRDKLAAYTALAYPEVAPHELKKIATEASSLHKILLDFADEGYTETVEKIQLETDALVFLPQFIAATLAYLGPPAEKERFYLYPEEVVVADLTEPQFDDGPTLDLESYLMRLDAQADTAPEIGLCFKSTEQRQHWEAKTQILMAEMVAFLWWIVERLHRQPTAVPVLLLRDTLLVYFGLTWLHQQGGVTVPPRPVFLSRKFTATFAEGETIYATLSSTIFYGILQEMGFCDLATLRQLFASRALGVFTESDPFTKGCRAYLKSLALTGPPLVIESGLHGTFPLWLLTLTSNEGELGLYTTAPWLYETYQDSIFRRNYNYLRETETIVLHDRLFQFNAFHQGTVFVTETLNSTAKSLAHYELHFFKQLVRQKMALLA
jgi:hypothetical protein